MKNTKVLPQQTSSDESEVLERMNTQFAAYWYRHKIQHSMHMYHELGDTHSHLTKEGSDAPRLVKQQLWRKLKSPHI